MASTAKWAAYNGADTAVAGTAMNALASGTAAANYALGAAIDNTSGGGGLFLYGDFELVLSSAVTAGSGAPFLAVYLVPAMDGTNYGTTNGDTSAGPTSPGYLVGTIQVQPSASVQVLHLRGIIMPPSLFKIMINNQLGVALPSTNTSTAKLYRYNEQAV